MIAHSLLSTNYQYLWLLTVGVMATAGPVADSPPALAQHHVPKTPDFAPITGRSHNLVALTKPPGPSQPQLHSKHIPASSPNQHAGEGAPSFSRLRLVHRAAVLLDGGFVRKRFSQRPAASATGLTKSSPPQLAHNLDRCLQLPRKWADFGELDVAAPGHSAGSVLREELEQRIMDLVAERGLIRARDIEALGISRRELGRLRDAGLLDQPARGLYARSDQQMSEHSSLAEAATLVPRGVICLLSALEYHGLTTQTTHQVWIALRPSDWLPTEGRLPLRVVRFSGAAFLEGVEQHDVDGVVVRVYSPAKTVADCFKYRNKLGTDLALEALRDCWRQKKCSMDELWHYARVCRVQSVMRPYLESLV